MAKVRFTHVGAVIELESIEVAQVSGQLNSGAATATIVAAIQGFLGISGAAATITQLISGILWLGSANLANRDRYGRGVRVTVLWVGLPWCDPR